MSWEKMCGKTRVGGLRGLGLWTLGPTWMYTVCLRVGGATRQWSPYVQRRHYRAAGAKLFS